MSKPAITVLLPVHNGALFLRKAIDSVLSQSLADFELLIINDGSTDDSEKIIFSYTDHRLRYVKNDQNLGLIETLNKGIDFAKGEYMARMDADDICVTDRLKMQKEFLDQHRDVGFVATTITLINENAEPTGFWPLDQKTISSASIRKTMILKNCISHPSVMGRTLDFRKLRYKAYQKNIEDYDLWLRALNSGLKIAKLPLPLLLYRQHSGSITSTHLKKNFFWLHYAMKKKFLINERKEGRMSMFTIKVFFAMLADGVTALFKDFKRLF